MDWRHAIEKNQQALKRIVAMLAVMIGVPGLLCGESRPVKLPRHLHRSILRLLRPAEAAARRLIVVAARGLVVQLVPSRSSRPKPRTAVSSWLGIAVLPSSNPPQKRSAPRPVVPSLPLFDPLKRWGRRRHVPMRIAPRITFDFDRPREPVPPPLSPDDPLDAGRLARRLQAIGRALDDLPTQAKRLARWQAYRDAADVAGDKPDTGHEGGGVRRKQRMRRLSPLRPGRPPGWLRKPGHEVYAVLNELHGLAFWARERPDTS